MAVRGRCELKCSSAHGLTQALLYCDGHDRILASIYTQMPSLCIHVEVSGVQGATGQRGLHQFSLKNVVMNILLPRTKDEAAAV